MIVLTLCDPCRELSLKPEGKRDGWIRLPVFCPECSAKVAQCVRLLVQGGKIDFPLTGKGH
jgi:hypothetical protein